MGDQRHKSPYRQGPRREMTAEWKEAVKARLAELGRTRVWLSETIGAKSQSSITQMLGDEQHASVWVDSVCHALDIPPPAVGLDALEQEALEIIKGLDPGRKRRSDPRPPPLPSSVTRS